MTLTGDTAPAFYQKHGYHAAPAIQAKNEMDVFIKTLNKKRFPSCTTISDMLL